MGVTIVDIAKRLGISDSTVSRVLNKKKDAFISQATREKVLAAAAEMGYRPNKLACALVTGRTNTIAFLASGERTHYYTEVTYHLQDRLRNDGYDLVTEYAKGPGLWNWQSPYLQRPFDGIIVCDPPFAYDDYLRQGEHKNTPWVSLVVFFWSTGDYVGVDLYAGAIKALEHLSKFGPRIDFVAPGPSYDDPRHHAYADIIEKHHLQPEYVIIPSYQRAPARQIIREHIQKCGCPIAIFCFNDNLAIGVHRGLRDLDLNIPTDVALVGCDGIEDTEYHDPAISTIDMNLDKMCNQACDFLLRRIKDPSARYCRPEPRHRPVVGGGAAVYGGGLRGRRRTHNRSARTACRSAVRRTAVAHAR
jgi:LacI family transcriptional regulator